MLFYFLTCPHKRGKEIFEKYIICYATNDLGFGHFYEASTYDKLFPSLQSIFFSNMPHSTTLDARLIYSLHD